MAVYLVVSDPKDWPLEVPGINVVSGRDYLTNPAFSKMRGAKVFNLSRHYRYQSTGYYVSLLAEARGHRPQPDISAIQSFRSVSIARESSEDLAELIQNQLQPLKSASFELSIYFGRNTAQRYQRLCQKLFNLFPAPMLRAYFVKSEAEGWHLQRVSTIPASEIPASHQPFVIEAATAYFGKKRWSVRKKKPMAYSMAILHDPEEGDSPSNEKALNNFIKAAASLGIEAELITRQDYGYLAEYDALFIRETTAVNHHTFRFARRAESLGLVVMDDPGSILRCTNKVYLAELLERHGVSVPKTMVVHRDNIDAALKEIGLPCVLKQPDSSFSQGVVKASTVEEYHALTEKLLSRSDLIIAQEFTPTDFDWRIGVVDRKPMWACRYFMASNHWQVIKSDGSDRDYGEVETLPLDQVPPLVLKTAMRAANLIGDGIYGVDLKQSGDRVTIMEVNDNPNVDAGYEDKILGQELYLTVMRTFLARIQARRGEESKKSEAQADAGKGASS